MIENSSFLQEAIRKHALTYVTGLFAVSPMHSVGLLYILLLVFSAAWKLSGFSRTSEGGRRFSASSQQLSLVILSLWPLAFLGGLTLIGVMGGGYQIRFILPILPATAVLAGVACVSAGPNVSPLVSVICAVSAIHMFYYAVLYPPLFADMGNSVFELVAYILHFVIDDHSSGEAMYKTFQVMKHYGLVLK